MSYIHLEKQMALFKNMYYIDMYINYNKSHITRHKNSLFFETDRDKYGIIHTHTHTHQCLSDRGSRTRVSPFAQTFEYYQTVALSNHRLAVDSEMAIVQFFSLRSCRLSLILVPFFVLFYSLVSYFSFFPDFLHVSVK